MVSDWRIVRDIDRGRVVDVVTVCGHCWPTHQATYTHTRGIPGLSIQVNVLTPTADDECHACGRHPEAA